MAIRLCSPYLLSLLKVALLILLIENSKGYAQPSHFSQESASGKTCMVATAHPLATQVGLDILRQGGNAVDAAVAVAFALGVVEPYASGIGGGGFMLIYSASKGDMAAIDFREAAPLKTPKEKKTQRLRSGPFSIAVPGMPAGLSKALYDHGTMDLKKVLEPAITLAEKGFIVNQVLLNLIEMHRNKLSKYPGLKKLFLNPRYKTGDLIRQPELARSYRLIAEKGTDVFYKGWLAGEIEREVRRLGGSLNREDLARYQPIARKPINGTYRGFEVYGLPPGSGGIFVLELLNIMEGYGPESAAHNSDEFIQFMAEAMRRVFRDKARYTADADFPDIPAETFTSKRYAEELRKEIKTGKLNRISMPDPAGYESDQTTHISVADGQGNLVSLTQTLNSFFGSGIVVPGTGILLNNEMSDFDSEGLNRPGPGKRPISNIAPIIVLKEGKPFMSLGMAGASRIISGIPQILVNIIDSGMSIQQAITAPRFYCSSKKIDLEGRIGVKTRDVLSSMGYEIKVRKDFDLFFGGAQGVMIDPKTGIRYGGADPRRGGAAEGF